MNIHVVGGAYREVCHWPNIDEVHGSGGRAAQAIAQLSQANGTTLHTILEKELENQLKRHFALLECDFRITTSNQTPIFEYSHPLAIPHIIPDVAYINQLSMPKLSVQEDNIVLFGMLESSAQVIGKRVVYDPQDSCTPKSFTETGSQANELVLVLNRSESRALYKKLRGTNIPSDIDEIARALLQTEKATGIIIKCGQQGAFVLELGADDGQWVPAFKTERVYPIGSGDCFVAAFSYFWMEKKLSISDAAIRASAVTAFYCETRTYPSACHVDNLLETFEKLDFSEKADKQVYLAGPFFNLKEMWMVNQARFALTNAGLKVFSPYHDIGVGPAEAVVKHDIEAIENSDVIYALFDGNDPGTLFEIGYAIKSGKPVVIFAESASEEELKMYEGTNCIICNDFSTSIYKTCWSLNEQ